MTASHLAAAALLAGVLAAPAALAQDPAIAPATAAPAAAAPAGPVTLTAKLSGDAEVGHEGDPDGNGTATIKVEPGAGRVCYDVPYRRIAPVDGAHIHAGEKGKNGPPVVALKLDPDEYVKGCVRVASEVASALLAAPKAHYVNVATSELKNGAIRGQLGK